MDHLIMLVIFHVNGILPHIYHIFAENPHLPKNLEF
jgi:hypothetical protein